MKTTEITVRRRRTPEERKQLIRYQRRMAWKAVIRELNVCLSNLPGKTFAFILDILQKFTILALMVSVALFALGIMSVAEKFFLTHCF